MIKEGVKIIKGRKMDFKTLGITPLANSKNKPRGQLNETAGDPQCIDLAKKADITLTGMRTARDNRRTETRNPHAWIYRNIQAVRRSFPRENSVDFFEASGSTANIAF